MLTYHIRSSSVDNMMMKSLQFRLQQAVVLYTIFLLLTLPLRVAAIPVAVHVGEVCGPGNDCVSSDEYCASDFTCKTIPYSPLITTTGAAASSDTTAFNIIMATDVQFYFKICKNEPLTDCIFHNVVNDVAVRNQLLVDAAASQTQCIASLASSLTDVKAVFNNGDLTNKGKSREITHLDTKFHDLISLPLVVGLGNHDYGVDDTSKGYSDEGRRDMVNYLADSIITLHGTHAIRSIDFDRTATVTNEARQIEEVYNAGSFCYSLEFNDYVFVVLHWSTALVAGAFEDDFQVDDTSGTVTKTEYFKVTSPETWLKGELDYATNNGKKVILVPHSYKGLKLFTDTVSGMSDYLRDSEVIAVLSGHVHDAWGYDQDMVVGTSTTRNIPVYYAGSASYQKLIAVELAANKGGLVVTPYDTSTGSACSSTGAASSAI